MCAFTISLPKVTSVTDKNTKIVKPGRKTWKDALLGSGLPLEYSVAQILKEFDSGLQQEYQYMRPNEHGIPTQFSVDQYVNLFPTQDQFVELFIESKYRRDGTQWLFSPQSSSFTNDFSFRETLTYLDAFSDVGKVNHEAVHRFLNGYMGAVKGVEIQNDQPNPQSIERGIAQLKYAISAEIPVCFEHQLDHLLGKQSPIFILLPVLVTTAQLWRLKEGTTIDLIRSAGNLSDIGDQLDVLFLCITPDNMLQEYTRKKLQAFFEARKNDHAESILRGRGQNVRFHIDHVSTAHPTLFVIVHLSKLRRVVGDFVTFFQNPDFIVK
ncbi:MAG: hypothetical protein A4E65_02485 [Syntrophorhabdus sp. PtaU1.Bin153]|nr:MAG: hypothetical protein A4E65_02485 [Syntrophorhabdus sp. PtaU1.Bin153]